LLGIRAVLYTPHCGAFLRTDISGGKQKLYRLFERIGGLLGGRLVGCGPSEAELYRNLGGMYKNAVHVSNGASPHAAPAPGRGKTRSLISFAGIASVQKDPALFSAIAGDCLDTVKKRGFSFCWIGEEPANAAEETLNRQWVEVTGWKKSAEVADLLGKTAIYLSCSAWEGFPYGVLEAMNASCALLLRDVPGNRDMVLEGENGRLFNTREEAAALLQEMIAKPETTAAMGKRSRAVMEQNYSLKQMGEGYRRIYEETALEAGMGKPA
jgi:glycosyltransferase involved in cell wall biosynthesis